MSFPPWIFCLVLLQWICCRIFKGRRWVFRLAYSSYCKTLLSWRNLSFYPALFTDTLPLLPSDFFPVVLKWLWRTTNEFCKILLKIGKCLHLSSGSSACIALLLQLIFVMHFEAKELGILFSNWASVIRCFIKDLSDLLSFCHIYTASISPQ